MEKSEFIEAGKIINTHGIRGEVKMEVWLDSPSFMKSFHRFFVKNKEYKVLSSFVQKNFLIAHLEGIDDVNQAMTMKENIVFIKREDAHLKEGSYFLGDIIGFDVVNEAGEKIGVLKEIFENPASMIYVVKGEQERLIPGVPEFILGADLEAGTLKVRLIEGM